MVGVPLLARNIERIESRRKSTNQTGVRNEKKQNDKYNCVHEINISSAYLPRNLGSDGVGSFRFLGKESKRAGPLCSGQPGFGPGWQSPDSGYKPGQCMGRLLQRWQP